MMYALIYSTELPEHTLSPPTLYILMKNRSIRDHRWYMIDIQLQLFTLEGIIICMVG